MAEREMFPATNGLATGVGGLVVAAVAAVLGLTWVDYRYAPVLLSIALLLAVLTYAVVLRPRVGIDGDDLVLRQVFSTTWIPLAAVQDFELRRIAVFRAGGRKYDSPALSRTRSTSRRVRRLDARLEIDPDERQGKGPTASEFISHRIESAMAAARSRAEVEEWSEEQEALAADVRTQWAWPLVALAVLAGLAVVVSLAA